MTLAELHIHYIVLSVYGEEDRGLHTQAKKILLRRHLNGTPIEDLEKELEGSPADPTTPAGRYLLYKEAATDAMNRGERVNENLTHAYPLRREYTSATSWKQDRSPGK